MFVNAVGTRGRGSQEPLGRSRGVETSGGPSLNLFTRTKRERHSAPPLPGWAGSVRGLQGCVGFMTRELPEEVTAA